MTEEAKLLRKRQVESETEEGLGLTLLPSAASAAAVHSTNTGLPKGMMLVVTNGFKRWKIKEMRDELKIAVSLVLVVEGFDNDDNVIICPGP